MNDEEKILLKRLNDLDHMADRKYMVCYSDFLNAIEYSLFLEHKKEYLCQTVVFEKIDQLERQMIAFIPEALPFNQEFPISILKIHPKSRKFAQPLSHRDILGTVMGLSIDRKLVGDIFCYHDDYYILVNERISDLIIQDIHRIKHTEVIISKFDEGDLKIEREYEQRFSTVSSLRLDCIISEMNNCSRSQAQELIKNGLIFHNSRQIFHNSTNCNAGDIISIRHVGKFRIVEFGGLSRKGKYKLHYEIFK